MLNRRYVDALIRRVGSLYGWTEGDHVPVRVGRLEQTALQTGMDHHNFGLIPKQAGVALLQQLHDEGRTIVMVTHNPELGKVADRVIRLQHGKLVENAADEMVSV